MTQYFIPSRGDECANFMDWCRLNSRVHDHIMYLPNEHTVSDSQKPGLFKIGLKKGVPRFFLALTNKKYAGCWLEMKCVGDEKKVRTQNEIDWCKRLNNAGYYCCAVFGWESAMETIKKYIDDEL